MGRIHEPIEWKGGNVDIRKKLVIGTVSLTVLGGLGATAALAKTNAPAKAPTKAAKVVVSEPVGGTDTDNVQEGDQSGSDGPNTAPAALAAASLKVAPSGTKVGANPADEGGENSGEGESQGESDGPGGHEDPPGNVDHQFDGEE
jgi:hypothetical protein